MKLQQLAAKPNLVKILIDDEDTVKTYGETVEFYVYDRQDLDVYMKIATVDSKNFSEIAKTINNLILDDKGKPILEEGMILPIDLTTKVVEKVIDMLGNTKTQTSKE